MIRISEEQINFIHKHINACMKIDWIEVRYELVDHIASIIEQKWVEDPNLEFRDAYIQTIDQLDHGREIKRMVSIQKRTAIKNYLLDYFKYLTNPKHVGAIIGLLGMTFLVTYFLIDTSTFITVLYFQWAVMALWCIFLLVHYMQHKLNPHSRSQSLKYRCYNEIRCIDLFFLLPLMLLISEYHTIDLMEMVIVGLCVFMLFSSAWYRYAIYRPAMLTEIKFFQDLEVGK